MVKISVIIPVYNSQDYLNECIDSVLNQTFSDFEVICVDDGSTDNSLGKLKSYGYDGRVKIISKSHGGPGATRNVALDIAQGDYILFLDADDYLKSDAMERTYYFAVDNSLDLILFKTINFNYETRTEFNSSYFDMKFLKESVGREIFNWKDVKNDLFDISVTATSKLFKREVIQDIRFPEGIIFEDNVFFIKTIFNAERVYFYDEYLYYRRIHPNSITNSYFKYFSDCMLMYELIYEFIKEIGLYDEFGEQIFNRQCHDIFIRFSQTDDEYKEDFFNKIKTNFLNRKSELEKTEILNRCSDRSREIFNRALDSKTYNEFELSVNVFDLKKDNSKLKLEYDIKKRRYESQISKLEKQNELYLNEINSLENSKNRNLPSIFKSSFNFFKRN